MTEMMVRKRGDSRDENNEKLQSGYNQFWAGFGSNVF
jgi:hypothetical protein